MLICKIWDIYIVIYNLVKACEEDKLKKGLFSVKDKIIMLKWQNISYPEIGTVWQNLNGPLFCTKPKNN